jgi:hypothetical protein
MGSRNRSRRACVQLVIYSLERVCAMPQALVRLRPWSGAAACASVPIVIPRFLAWPVRRACLLETTGAFRRTRTDPTGYSRCAGERIVRGTRGNDTSNPLLAASPVEHNSRQVTRCHPPGEDFTRVSQSLDAAGEGECGHAGNRVSAILLAMAPTSVDMMMLRVPGDWP